MLSVLGPFFAFVAIVVASLVIAGTWAWAVLWLSLRLMNRRQKEEQRDS